jgi:predicted dehydrogenase
MTGRRIRVGLIGTGRSAGFVRVPSLRLLPDRCEVTAVVSRDAARAKAFAQHWGIPRAHDTWEALVGDPELDAIVHRPRPSLMRTGGPR